MSVRDEGGRGGGALRRHVSGSSSCAVVESDGPHGLCHTHSPAHILLQRAHEGNTLISQSFNDSPTVSGAEDWRMADSDCTDDRYSPGKIKDRRTRRWLN